MNHLRWSISRLAVTAMLLLSFSGCDIIDFPLVDLGINYQANVYGPPPVFTPLPANMKFKHVLLEDFTGHECGNCPAAHAIAAQLKNQYGDSLSVVAIHATSLALPNPPEFPANYMTPEGNAYWQPLTGLGIPIGRINRSGGLDNPWPYSLWSSGVAAQFDETPVAVMQMQVQYVAANQVMNVHVGTEFLSSSNANFNLVILITENHIISPQLEYTPAPVVHEDYHHEHMLRGSVSGASGLLIASQPAQGYYNTSSYTYPWNPQWVPENCTIVAFIYNTTTGEIINCVEADLN